MARSAGSTGAITSFFFCHAPFILFFYCSLFFVLPCKHNPRLYCLLNGETVPKRFFMICSHLYLALGSSCSISFTVRRRMSDFLVLLKLLEFKEEPTKLEELLKLLFVCFVLIFCLLENKKRRGCLRF